jgi:hypothetical protein
LTHPEPFGLCWKYFAAMPILRVFTREAFMSLPLFPGKSGAAARLVSLCALLSALGGCMSVPITPTSFTPAAGSATAKPMQLTRPVVVLLPNETSVTLQGGTQWIQAGAIPQGQVYRKASGTLLVDAQRLRESYLVVSNNALTGFYFPGESAYSPAAFPVQLNLEQVQ